MSTRSAVSGNLIVVVSLGLGVLLLMVACRKEKPVGGQPTGRSDMADSAPPSESTVDQSRLRNAIRAQVEDMQKRFLSGDLDGFISYIHRDIIVMAGGPDKMREKMEPELSAIVKTIEKMSVGEVSEVVDDGGRLVAFVPVETVYRFPTGGLLQRTYRIACSEDGGKTWTFMDGQGRKDQETFFRSRFPILTEKIPFPQCTSEKR